MTEEKISHIEYLDREGYRIIHSALAEWSDAEEPIPPFELAKDAELDALVNLPRQQFFGIEAYPTLEEKAAIIFYSINKNQIFLNGNKRMSALSLLVFLGINNKKLRVSSDQLTEKALWLAQTESIAFLAIKDTLVNWIRSHVVDEILDVEE